ncbi:MAG: exopolyphosphatase [Oscillospiraceae bacterium]|jgi:nanoRNase/pAp phosphatase (c-di-AMP/oligoRNAs hydrolase)|nr:exopolyphosphatase [Oscillospiraceae bacterium]
MRLVTRSDFDGLACGALLKTLGIIDTWKFVHPKDMQDGLIEVTDQDVLTNVPYVPGCGMWFDHHTSEMERVGRDRLCPGECRPALSAARVIYDYYDGEKKLPHFRPMIEAVDRVDSGLLTVEEVLRPTGWVLLGFIMDPRTGLGRFRDFRISNLELMVSLLDWCALHTIDEILLMPDVQERVEMYFQQDALFRRMILDHAAVRGSVIVVDLRDVNPIYTGNRFLLYSLFPEQNVSVWVVDGRMKQNCSIAVGRSIINRGSKVDIGSLMLRYGGGGHVMVGTCQVEYNKASQAIEEIVSALNA